jgi:hypothetical protein
MSRKETCTVSSSYVLYADLGNSSCGSFYNSLHIRVGPHNDDAARRSCAVPYQYVPVLASQLPVHGTILGTGNLSDTAPGTWKMERNYRRKLRG